MIDFQSRRHDPAFHIGLGDIRLTIADQDEISAELSSLRAELAQAQAVLSDIAETGNGKRPADQEAHFMGFIPTGVRKAREYFAATPPAPEVP